MDAATIKRTPVAYPQGGGSVTVSPNLQQIAAARTEDGSSRRWTAIITSVGRTPLQGGNDYTGVAARITQGTAKGLVRVWTGIPAVIPVEGTHVTIEAMLAPLPYTFGVASNGILGSNVLGPLPGVAAVSAADPGLVCTAYLADEWADEPLDTVLWDGAATSTFGTPNVLGPVFVTSIKFANRNTSGVQFAILDRNGGSATTYPIVDKVFAPGGATVGLNLSKPFFRGVCVAGCTNWNAPAVYDANAADVDVSIYGYFLGL